MTEAAGTRLEVLVFEVGGQRYALRSPDVRELVRAVTVVPLPKAPAIIEGIINVRGAVVPVLDVRTRFRLPAKAPTHTDHLILASTDGRLVALRADRALALAQLEASEVEDAKSVVPGTDYVAGVAKLPDGLVLIHDLQTFLSRAEAAGLDEADVNGLLDWIESHWQPDGQPDWGDEDLPDAPSPGAFRYFGENDSECLSGAGLGYLLKLLNGGQINRAQLEALVQYASFMAVRPLEPEELDSILEQVIFRPGRPHMTGGSSEGFGSVH